MLRQVSCWHAHAATIRFALTRVVTDAPDASPCSERPSIPPDSPVSMDVSLQYFQELLLLPPLLLM